jgi:hypothetical protein
MREITWQAEQGKEIKVTVDIKASEEVYSDGWGGQVKSGKYIEIPEIVAEVESMGVVGRQSEIDSVAPNNRGIVGRIGKLGLLQDRYDQIKQAIEAERKELTENNQDYADYLRRQEEGRKIAAEHEEYVEKIERAAQGEPYKK